MGAWTKEPWKPTKVTPSVCDADGNFLFDAGNLFRRDRIIACVNACAGMDDPAAQIEAMCVWWTEKGRADGDKSVWKQRETELAALRIENGRLRKAFARYGRCRTGCSASYPTKTPCDCGYDEFLTLLAHDATNGDTPKARPPCVNCGVRDSGCWMCIDDAVPKCSARGGGGEIERPTGGPMACPDCGGNGTVPRCPTCNGRGKVCEGGTPYDSGWKPCPTCKEPTSG